MTLTLRPLRADDTARIKQWPRYEGVHQQMDYALRDGGWLDTFAGEPDTFCYGAEAGDSLVGFGLLIGVEREAELRLAVHPRCLGVGLGEQLALGLLARAFGDHGVAEIGLIVRQNNHPARKLYEKLGFRQIGETTRPVMGKEVDFWAMSLACDRFLHGRKRI